MPSLSFDRIAHAYDATRGYPNGITGQIIQAIERAANATAQTRFIEVGVGTGRIAFPLASLGHIYTGVDISEKMVEQLQEKIRAAQWQAREEAWGSLPDEDTAQSAIVHRYANPEQLASLRLMMADITALPLRNASFDVAVGVHIFHLVDGWQKAIQEIRRVLRPGGMLLHCWDEHNKLDIADISGEWQKILQSLGGNTQRPGASSVHFVTDWLTEQGLQPQKIEAVSWEHAVTPRQILDHTTQRIWSNTWNIPDAIFVPATERLTAWVHEHYRDSIDTPRVQERRFVISKTVF